VLWLLLLVLGKIVAAKDGMDVMPPQMPAQQVMKALHYG
jgi:hypothetical protein